MAKRSRRSRSRATKRTQRDAYKGQEWRAAAAIIILLSAIIGILTTLAA